MSNFLYILRRIIMVLLLFCVLYPASVLSTLASPSIRAIFYNNHNDFVLNGRNEFMDAAPFIEQDRLFVPVRYLARTFGIPDDRVLWDFQEQSVTIKNENIKVLMQVGNPVIHINNSSKKMDVAPQIRDGRVYLPARYLAEAFGYKIEWDDAFGLVRVMLPESEKDQSGLTLPTENELSEAAKYEKLGKDFYDGGDYDKALEYLNRAVELDPDRVAAYKLRAYIYLYKDERQKAIDDFTMVIELDPGDDNAYHNRGASYEYLGDYFRASSDYSAALRINPNAVDYQARGNLYMEIRYFEKAISDYSKVVELDPQNAEAYNSRGVAYHCLGEEDRCIDDIKKAIELDPDYSAGYRNLGVSYYYKGRYDSAIVNLKKSMELKDRSLVLNNYYCGAAYFGKGEYSKAIMYMDITLGQSPGFKKAFFVKGLSNLFNGDYDKAVGDFDVVIKMDSWSGKAYHYRGLAYAYKKDYDKAISDFDRAIKFEPDFAEAYYNRGITYFIKNDPVRGEEDIIRAIGMDSELKGMYEKEGKRYLGKREDKEDYYDLRMGPGIYKSMN